MPNQLDKNQGKQLMERLSDRLTDNLNANQQTDVIEQITGFSELYGKDEQVVDRLENLLNRTNNNSVRNAAGELLQRIKSEGNVDEERVEELREAHLN